MDEILSVGDADFQEKSRQADDGADERRNDGAVVSHSLQQIREMCDRVVWLEHGEVQMVGETREICNTYEL